MLCGVFAARAATDPQELIKTTTEAVTTRVAKEKEALRSDPGKTYELVSELIFPSFDFATIAPFVLGAEQWQGADEAHRAAFVEQFRKFMVRTYATALLEYSDHPIRYPEAAVVKDGTAFVKQEIVQPGGTPMVVNYRLSNKTGEWRVIEVVVDGVALMKTYRGSFQGTVKEKGLDGLIADLTTKNAELNK
jgi:phospholipid transport system substrate-binding protein